MYSYCVLFILTEIANSHAQAYAERQAVNSTVQGSAADLVKKAMLDIHTRFLWRNLLLNRNSGGFAQ